MNNDTIPYFEDEENKMREGFPIVERENVEVFVLDRTEQKLLCLDWKDFGWRSVIMGGIEGDSPIEAAKKEVREETGYLNINFVSEIGKTRSQCYAKHKNENRIANTVGLFFELANHEKDEVAQAELAKHVPEWVSIDEVTEYLTISSQKYLWEILKNSL
jgi:8-oxo-dGTP pyrophosphatase MutT (NUDIX family)